VPCPPTIAAPSQDDSAHMPALNPSAPHRESHGKHPKTEHPYTVYFNNRSTISASTSNQASRLIPELEKTPYIGTSGWNYDADCNAPFNALRLLALVV
jgi:hypothetical protein